jgi:hypothetical protein
MESAGTWAAPVEVATTGTTGLFYGVSCPDASFCTAVGYDEGTNEPFYDYLAQSVPHTTTSSRAPTTTTTAPTTTTTLPTTTTTMAPSSPPTHVVLKLTVSFATGSATLSRQNQTAVARFVGTVISQRRHIVRVSGFASQRGSANENSSLVIRRAQVVASDVRLLLIQRHIRSVTIQIVPGGIKYLPSPLEDQVATLIA